MPNINHLKKLSLGFESWNKWRKENPTIVPDLSGGDFKSLDLSHVNFSLCNLRNADFSGAILHWARFGRADLLGANLSRANLFFAELFKSDLSEANLSNTNLSFCTLTDINFTNVNLNETEFGAASLSGVIFGFTNLNNCKGLEAVIVKGPCSIDYQTLKVSKKVPKKFLKKIGLPDLYIEYLPDLCNEALEFYPVFLSHSSLNKEFARKLYEALIANGVSVFFDEKKLKPGDDILESITKNIGYYDKMILVCSEESLSESWWVDKEIDRIQDKERRLLKEINKKVNLLIPITIDNFIYSWEGTRSVDIKKNKIGDFTNWNISSKFEEAVDQLIIALNVDRFNIKPSSKL